MSTEPLSPQDALVAIMIAMSAADEDMTASEFKEISATMEVLPVFAGYDYDRMSQISGLVAELFTEEDGLDALLGLIESVLPDHLRETAYALACDVAAADGMIASTELRLLEEIRHELRVGRLTAAAIERGARARHQPLEAQI